MIPLFRRVVLLFLCLPVIFLCACSKELPDADPPPPTKKADPAPVKEKVVTVPLVYEEYGDTVNNAEEYWMHVALGSSPLQMQYPKLAEALDSLNAEYDKFANEEITAFNEALESNKKKYGSEFFPGGVLNRYTFLPRRADTRIVSLIGIDEHREGTKNPTTVFRTFTMDSRTGKRLTLDDVFNDFGAFIPTLAEELVSTHPRVYFQYRNDDLKLRITELFKFGDLGFTVDYEGITFYFNTGSVASAYYNMLTVSYPYDRLKGLINEEYAEIPEAYICMFTDTIPSYSDLTYKATSGNVLGIIDRFKLTYHEKTLDVRKINWVTFRAFLVHLGADNEYVYVDTNSSTGYGSIYVYKLTEEGPQEVTVLEKQSFFSLEMGDSQPLSVEMFTSPERFTLGIRCDLLATSVAKNLYKLDKDCMPVLLYDEYLYDVDSMHEYTLREDIRDTDGVLLKEGTTFIFVQTDMNDKVIIVTDDGLEHTVLLSSINVKRAIDGIEYATQGGIAP